MASFTSADGLLPGLWRFYRDLPAMLLHPRVSQAMAFYLAGPANAQFEVPASSPAVQRFVEGEIARFWDRSLFQVQEPGYGWGWGGCQAYYTVRDGLLSCEMLDAFESRDVEPLTVAGNRYVGLRVRNVEGGGRGHADLWGPGRAPAKGFWYVHRPKKGRLYGYAQPFPAWRPWRRLAGRDGAEEVIDQGVYRFAYCGPVGRYPANESEEAGRQPPGQARQSSREKMQALTEAAKAGISIALSSRRDDKDNYVWDLEWPQHVLDTSPLINYANWIEGQIDEGIGVPSELMEAAETGSGYSGRMIPLEGYFQGQQHHAAAVVRQWKEQIGDPLVRWNFGRGAWFDVKVKPLLETRRQSLMAPAGGTAPPAAGQSAGGGQQPQSQLVVGPKGGHWKVGPDGSKYHAQLATDAPAAADELAGPSLGCALLRLPAELADKVRALAAEVPDGDLHDKGRENDPHLTVKYGLLLDDAGPVARAVEGMAPVPVTLGPTGVFRATDTGNPFDVVYVSVVSPAAAALRRLLADLPNLDPHLGYTPHVTLAYVKPGRGLYHAGDEDLDGETATLDTLVYSDGRERATHVPLDGSAAPAELAARNPAFEERHPRDESGRWTENDGPHATAAREAHAAAVKQSGGKAATPEHWRALAEHGHHLGTDDLLHLARRLNWLPRGRAMTREQVLGRLEELGRKHAAKPAESEAEPEPAGHHTDLPQDHPWAVQARLKLAGFRPAADGRGLVKKNGRGAWERFTEEDAVVWEKKHRADKYREHDPVPFATAAPADPEFEKKHPRGEPENAGEFAPKGGGGAGKKPAAKPAGGVKVKPTKARAFAGKPVAVKKPLGKQDAGKIGEDAVIGWLHANGLKDARHLNLDRNNFPIDLVQDHAVIEVKTGQVSNGPKAQQWRLTIGEPGKAEKAWLASASAEEKAAWNARKQKMITERKKKALADLQKKLGHAVKARTVTCLINPDTRTIDIYQFDGWHDRIGWNSPAAKAAYAGSVRYG